MKSIDYTIIIKNLSDETQKNIPVLKSDRLSDLINVNKSELINYVFVDCFPYELKFFDTLNQGIENLQIFSDEIPNRHQQVFLLFEKPAREQIIAPFYMTFNPDSDKNYSELSSFSLNKNLSYLGRFCLTEVIISQILPKSEITIKLTIHDL